MRGIARIRLEVKVGRERQRQPLSAEAAQATAALERAQQSATRSSLLSSEALAEAFAEWIGWN